jgi:iron complex outermembrane receptor protein
MPSALQGSVSGPVADGVRARLSAYSDTRDGYIRNTVSGTGGNDFQRYGLRARVDTDLSERLSVKFNAAYDVNNSSVINYALLRSSPTLSAIAGAFGVKLPSDVYARTAAANFEPHEHFNMFRGSLTGAYDLGGGSQFTSITAYQGFHDNNVSDVDYTALDLLDGGNITYQKQYSQEFRFNNDPNARFSYLLGAFFFRQTMKDRGFNTVRPALAVVTGGAFPSGAKDQTMTSTSVQSVALFGQASYKVTDKFTATAGVRFDDQDNRHARVQPQGVTIPNLGALKLSKSESNVSGSASLRYAFNRDLNGYATVSRGYKGGGYNGFGVASAAEIGFRPETATNYEMGLKGYALERRVTFDITAFHMEVSDLQVSNFDGANFVVGNAAAATTEGVELNVSASPSRELTLNFGLSYDEATYDSYPGAPCTAAQKLATAAGVSCTQNLAGRQIANAPKLHGTLSAQYEHLFESVGFSVFGRVDYAYLSKQYLQTALAPATLQKGYGLLNGRLGLRTADQGWGLFLTGANIGNTKYLRNAYDYPLFTGAYLAAPNRPRTWGVELQAEF